MDDGVDALTRHRVVEQVLQSVTAQDVPVVASLTAPWIFMLNWSANWQSLSTRTMHCVSLQVSL